MSSASDEVIETENPQNPYQRGYIYWVKCRVDPRVYFGSSILTEEERWSGHKRSAKNIMDTRKFYTEMRRIGIEHFYLEKIEDYPCENRDELERREFLWIEGAPESLLFNTVVVYRKLSDVTKAKMSASSIGKDPTMGFLGRTHSEESRAKMSEAMKGKFGSKHPKFKGGSIINDRINKRFRIQWSQLKEPKTSKSFSYGVRSGRTEAEALALAEEFKASLKFD